MGNEAAVLEAIQQVKSEIDGTMAKLAEAVEKQDAEIRKIGGTSTETSTAIKGLEESLRKRSDDLIELQKSIAEIEKRLGRPDLGNEEDDSFKTVGQRFVESAEYKAFQGHASLKRMQDEFKLRGFFPTSGVTGAMRRKDITGASSLREILATERILEIISSPMRTDRVRDLFQVIPTTNGSIEYVKETGFTNNAAAVQENTGGQNDVAKPRSTITFASVSTSVKTIAHWTPAPKQLVRDIPALQAYIDGRLIMGLGIVEDEELLFGDGTGAHVEGIMQVSGVQTYNWSDGVVGDTKIDAIRRAMGKVRVAEFRASGIVVSANDWTDIELMKDSEKRYIWTVVTEGGQKRLFAVPVVDTTAMTDGDFLTGAFLGGANVWDREEAAITIGDQHEDFMVKNLLAILAEERLALTVYRPESFCVGAFDEEPGS